MASVVKIKRSSVRGKNPTTSDISTGELALNINDGKLFSTDGVRVFEIGANVHSLAVGTGGVTFANGAMTFPTTDGTSGQYLKTDGSGTLSWADVEASSGVDSASYTNSTIIGDTLFADTAVDLGTLDSPNSDAFGVLVTGELLDCMEPPREIRIHDFAVLS